MKYHVSVHKTQQWMYYGYRRYVYTSIHGCITIALWLQLLFVQNYRHQQADDNKQNFPEQACKPVPFLNLRVKPSSWTLTHCLPLVLAFMTFIVFCCCVGPGTIPKSSYIGGSSWKWGGPQLYLQLSHFSFTLARTRWLIGNSCASIPCTLLYVFSLFCKLRRS